MDLHLETVKKHWPQIAVGVVGALVLYFLYKALSHPAAASASDGSGGDRQLLALSSAADLTNAQTNAQITTAAYQAGVQTSGIAAQLQDSLAKTAAQLNATNRQTDASLTASLSHDAALVSIQDIRSAESVANTRIQGQTILGLATTSASVKKAQISTINNQIDQIFKYSKHFGSDIQAFAPIVALEAGSPAAADLGYANAQTKTSGNTANTVSSIAKATTGILGALFG